MWVQSSLAGIPAIACGFRDQEGKVSKIEQYQTKDIPAMAKSYWDPKICTSFAESLLTWLLQNSQQGNRYTMKFVSPYTEIVLELKDS
jgi:hypothetical protein